MLRNMLQLNSGMGRSPPKLKGDTRPWHSSFLESGEHVVHALPKGENVNDHQMVLAQVLGCESRPPKGNKTRNP